MKDEGGGYYTSADAEIMAILFAIRPERQLLAAAGGNQ